MLGENKVASPRHGRDGFLVNEVWYTIQGEGPWAGRPAIFLRLASCNLRCYFCDTEFERGVERTVDSLANQLRSMMLSTGCHQIVITGGEPMLQEIGLLFWHPALAEAYFQIETAGTVWPSSLPALNSTANSMPCAPWVIVCSPKTRTVHGEIVKRAQYFKYILRSGEVSSEDGLPLVSTQIRGKLDQIYRPHALDSLPTRNRVYVQPMDEGDAALNHLNMQAAVQSSMKFGYRLSVQMHKVAGVP